MRALVTNDDGVFSDGIALLTRIAVEAGLDVVVAAPHEERSGASASLTGMGSDSRLAVTTRSIDGLADVPVYAVKASPALIAFVATRGAFGDPPDLVLSGINHGPNTGSAVLHSGTVGAALTASTHGVVAMAASLATTNPTHWDTAELVVRDAVRWTMENGRPDSVLNVNIPDVPLHELEGVAAAPLAEFGAVQAEIGDRGEGFVTVRFDEIVAESDDDSDAGLIGRKWATVTSLRAPSAVDVDLAALTRTISSR
ncbi:5'/3'-nucleotidase SurE [Rhodococcus sp. Eu-32]|uniref:5'/3'-nucleotidase SurE n=1 Tax=Rhodococcus sp. Eu-32 TaxID=1017319 RepID=UPI000DF32697|nr:5'/3'-nucleotidase SurE [Rhodococcus sp. Eu-32]RRQ27212.1 5'/3'-nucleotidase SurE [Rhodococcus sp. Eu-32]